MNKINIKDPVEKLEKQIENINKVNEERSKSILRKYPIIFSLLITFALVCILYGFELILSKIDFVTNNPWILVILGLTILISTGGAYKILDRRN